MRSPLRTLGSLAAVALLALTAACSKPSASLEQPKEWSREVPSAYGRPLDARVAEGTLLVTTTVGLIGVDPATGAQKWWRDFAKDFDDGSEMSRGIAQFRITIAGDAVVVTKSAENTPGSTGRSGREILDLATGVTRFTIVPKTDSADGWFFTHVTPTSIVTFECVDLVECDITSLPLDGGAPKWTLNLPGGRVDLPDQLSWNQERTHSSDGNSPPSWRVSGEPEFALVNNHKTDTATTVDLDTGRIIGEWKRADTRAWYVLLGPTVVEVGGGVTVRGLDPATGEERWAFDPIAGATTPFGYHGHLVDGGLLIDESESGEGAKKYQFVDLLTGPQGGPVAAPQENALVVTPGLVVTVNEMLSEVTATDPATGEKTWTSPLPNGDGTYRLFESVFIEGTLVITGTTGFDDPGALHAVDTATGRVRTWDGQWILGTGEGLIVALSGDEHEGKFALHSHWL
ncbi:MAG TPA: PQQ-binding-like beta-propeller repeat protein [Phytomonospora sp.]